MLFTIKSSKSERFFQFNFNGFRPRGRNFLETIIETIAAFLKSIQKYIFKRIRDLLISFIGFVVFIQISAVNAKSLFIRKLIWSRGRLGRTVSTVFVMSASFFIFIFGEVFNSSKFVNNQEVSADYIKVVNDIIPRRNSALTTIPENRQRLQPIPYTVVEGDSLVSIGNQFKVSTAALTYVNDLRTADVKVGQVIIIPPASGLFHKVAQGDTIDSIAKKYDVPSQLIVDFNYILNPSKLVLGTELVIPDAKIPSRAVEVPIFIPPFVPKSNAKAKRDFCVWPTVPRIITTYFSWSHNGIDIAVPWGQPMPKLFACNEGVVIRAGVDPYGYGLHVRIDHGNGYVTLYGHMSKINVALGEEVKRGQVIGLMGNTGRSSGPHLHFTVLYEGVAQNPFDYTN